ncbi:DUF2306 domain-containing protein [Flexivirga sp. B27]
MSQPQRTLSRPARVGLWALAIGSLIYIPGTVLAMLPYFHSGAWTPETAFRDLLPGTSVAAHSIHEALAGRKGPYLHSEWPMIIHTVLGGGIMLLGPWQLFTGSRRRMMRGHRWLGRTYALVVGVSMLMAAVYLVRTPWTEVFSGPVFAVGLWGFWTGVVVSLVLGIAAIRRGAVERHLRWMVFGYACLMSAPLIRLGWTLIMGLDHSVPMPRANIYTGSMLFGICTIGATIGARAIDRRRVVPGMRRTWVSENTMTACVTIGIVGYIVLGMLSFTWHPQWGPTRIYYSATWFVVLGISAASALRHRARGTHPYAEQEWRVTFAAHILAPAVGLLFAGILIVATGVSAEVAEMAGVAVGWGACGLGAFLVIDRELRRAAARAPRLSYSDGRVSAKTSDVR